MYKTTRRHESQTRDGRSTSKGPNGLLITFATVRVFLPTDKNSRASRVIRRDADRVGCIDTFSDLFLTIRDIRQRTISKFRLFGTDWPRGGGGGGGVGDPTRHCSKGETGNFFRTVLHMTFIGE